MSMRKLVLCLAVSALSLTLVPERPALATPAAPAGVERVLVRMIEAVKAQSYDDFLTDADDHLKTNLSRQQFEGICGLYTAPLRKGYRLEYLGQLRQQGTYVYLWKITIVGGQDETLLRLVTKDGKAYGFAVS